MHDNGLYLARWDDGFVIRVVGRGSMRESPAFRETVASCLKRFPKCHIVVDLSDCYYLDSTFMGGMIWLHKYAGEKYPDRLRFAADSSKCHQLFVHSLLDRVLNIIPTCPPFSGEILEIPATDLDREDLGEHIEQCHRKLAELGGPQATTFTAIADRLNREIGR